MGYKLKTKKQIKVLVKQLCYMVNRYVYRPIHVSIYHVTQLFYESFYLLLGFNL